MTQQQTSVELVIRDMVAGDIKQVMRVEYACFSDPWSENALLTEAMNPAAYYAVCSLGAHIIGFAGMWIIMDECHITNIGVLPEYRRKGYGERLLIAILKEAIARGATRATLECRRSNFGAQQLYGKYDFTTVAIRRGYYRDNNEDAVVMWVNDIHSLEYRKKLKSYAAALEGEGAAT